MNPQGFNGQGLGVQGFNGRGLGVRGLGGQGLGGQGGKGHGRSAHASNNGGAGHSNVTVDFRMQADHLDARSVHLVGEFNDWSSTATPMVRSESQFVVSLQLQTGRTYRYKFLVDGQRWENDWNADAYVSNEFGGDDSVLDLTDMAGSEPAAQPNPEPQHNPETRPKPDTDASPSPDDPDSPGRAIDEREGEIPEPNEPA